MITFIIVFLVVFIIAKIIMQKKSLKEAKALSDANYRAYREFTKGEKMGCLTNLYLFLTRGNLNKVLNSEEFKKLCKDNEKEDD